MAATYPSAADSTENSEITLTAASSPALGQAQGSRGTQLTGKQ
ncbi:hypothetical protein [Hymenobacter terrenus]|nr:hypothetical protein [Hymenobacter terrenus]